MKQKMRFSDEELALMKSLFADNDALLYGVRNVFLEFDLTDAQKKAIDAGMKSQEAQDLVRKLFLPELSPDVPFGQMVDLLMSVQISDKTPEEADLMIQARELVISLTESHLSELTGSAPGASYKSLATDGDDLVDRYINLNARNTYVQHIETVLIQVNHLSGQKEETVEETKARLEKNSAK